MKSVQYSDPKNIEQTGNVQRIKCKNKKVVSEIENAKL